MNNDLRKLQLSELEMLKKLDSILEKEKINYFALGGTVLGAVRHKGFIPWDDDIDIGMLRKDFEYFEKNIQSMLPKDFIYFDSENNSIRKGPLGKLFYLDERNKEESRKNILEMPSIDIFPLDNVPDSKLLEKVQSCMSKIYHLSVCQRVSVNRGKINYYISKILLFLIPKLLFKYFLKISKKIMLLWNKKNTKYINNIYGVNFEKIERKCFSELIKVPFEDIYIKIPKNYDLYLRTLYGKYNELPSKEQRKPKHKKEI